MLYGIGFCRVVRGQNILKMGLAGMEMLKCQLRKAKYL